MLAAGPEQAPAWEQAVVPAQGPELGQGRELAHASVQEQAQALALAQALAQVQAQVQEPVVKG